MRPSASTVLLRVLTFVTVLLIGKVTFSIVLGYRDYFPANFESDFLRGREAYYWGAYRWAFYVHLASGPVSLILGTILVSERFRRFAPAWHRRLGRSQGLIVLLLVAPSGLWMAYYAQTGAVAAAGLGTLALATGVCVALGWRAAVQRKFVTHRRWMLRTYILLCSAVVIRMIGGLATVTHFDALWVYPFSTWVSWLVPLVVLESLPLFGRPVERIATTVQPVEYPGANYGR